MGELEGAFLTRVVALHRPCLNHDARIAFLDVLALGRYRTSDVTTCQEDGCGKYTAEMHNVHFGETDW